MGTQRKLKPAANDVVPSQTHPLGIFPFLSQALSKTRGAWEAQSKEELVLLRHNLQQRRGQKTAGYLQLPVGVLPTEGSGGHSFHACLRRSCGRDQAFFHILRSPLKQLAFNFPHFQLRFPVLGAQSRPIL